MSSYVKDIFVFPEQYLSYFVFLPHWLKISIIMNGIAAFPCSFNRSTSNFSSFDVAFAVDLWHIYL